MAIDIFGFGAVPYPELEKTKTGIASIYNPKGTSGKSTLSNTLYKALKAYAKGEISTGNQGLATTSKGQIIAELETTNPNEYDLVVYNRSTGSLLASTLDLDSGISKQYVVGRGKRMGTAVMFTILPLLLEDSEFKSCYEDIKADLLVDEYSSISNTTLFENSLHVMSDNAHCRINGTQTYAVKVAIPSTGNITPLKTLLVDNGTYAPDAVMIGEIKIFTEKKKKTSKKVGSHDRESFLSDYVLNPTRVFTDEEKARMVELPSYYQISDAAVKICKHIKMTNGKQNAMKNFLLRGPAGTGKTMDAKAIACAVGLPYGLKTCSANDEIFDVIGQLIPSTGSDINITAEDVMFDTEGAYEALTGKKAPKGIDETEVLNLLIEKKTEAKGFRYVETDLLKAIKYGWVCEIQEPTVISQPGVLVGLNSLLEQDGSITLPTGEVIKRHPDCIIIVTTNINYEGCRTLNQSLVSRMNLCIDKPLPSKEEIVNRVYEKSSFKDKTTLEEMVEIAISIDEYCRENEIADGVCGVREILDWAESVAITGDVFDSAKDTIISKVTTDEEEIQNVISTYFEPTAFYHE